MAIFLAALSTLIVGFVWYNPKVFGTIWMKESGVNPEKMIGSNMFLLFGASFFYAILISLILQMLTIHQFGALGMIGGDPAIAKPSYISFMADYGNSFRTFKHGALHGFMAGLFFALPVIGTNALYERRSFKYTLVNGGFWIVCLTIMGGIICAWK
nr:DUF1761 domain-containing protein [Flavobacterium caseinilyticum]